MENNNITDIVTITTLIVTLIGTIFGWVTQFIKDGKIKKTFETINFWVDNLRPLIAQAEKLAGISSEGKKKFVKERLRQLCDTYNIKYDDAKVDAIIEQLLAFSKQVNIDELNKEK